MNKADVTNLLSVHSKEITQLQIATSKMMLLWRVVGAVALVALGSWVAKGAV